MAKNTTRIAALVLGPPVKFEFAWTAELWQGSGTPPRDEARLHGPRLVRALFGRRGDGPAKGPCFVAEDTLTTVLPKPFN